LVQGKKYRGEKASDRRHIIITVITPGKHDVKELHKTATLGAAHTIRKVLMWKYKTYLTL
jgi:hypothetical protein